MVPGMLLALLGVGSAVVVGVGGPLVLTWAVAIAALTLVFRRWCALPAALGYATVVFLAAELALLYLGPLLATRMPVPDVVLWTAVSVAAGIALAVRPAPRPSRRGWWTGLAAASGSIVVVVSVLLAQVVPGALRLAWAMNSDAVNVLTFSRDILAAGGLSTPSSAADTSPTPLPFGMLAAALAPGRTGVADGALAEHDVVRLAQLWIMMIALACALAGAIVLQATERVRLSLAVAAIVVASLAGLSWYVIGVQFGYGFLSSAFAVALLLAAWLVFLDAETRPALGLATLLLGGTVMLGVWSPLIACVAAMGIALVAMQWRAIRSAGAWRLALVGAATVVLLAYVALVTAPEYLAKSAFLGANGGFPAFGPGQVLTILAVTALVAALGARLLGAHHSSVGALAVVVGGGLGLAFLLGQRAGAESGWGYYPAKYGWTVTILAIMIAIGLGSALLQNADPRRRWDVATALLGVGLVAALLWSPVQPLAQVPLLTLLKGTSDGMSNRAADLVLEHAGRDNGQDVFWRSTVGDSWPNLWLLQLDIDDNHHNPVRSFAYQLSVFTPEQMCEVVDLLGSAVVIRTADPAAEPDLAAVCRGRDYSIIVGDY